MNRQTFPASLMMCSTITVPFGTYGVPHSRIIAIKTCHDIVATTPFQLMLHDLGSDYESLYFMLLLK
jgi:hypothetical protein